MIQTSCSKCGADLILHEGYGVCSNCGEIIGFDVEEEKEEVIKESVEEAEVTEEEAIETTEAAENIENEVTEHEEVTDEASNDEIQEETLFEEKEEAEEVIKETVEENIIPEEIEKPKKKKTPIIILVVVILCILAVLGGYFISKANKSTTDTNAEDVLPEEDIIEETEKPQAIDEEPEVEAEQPAADPEVSEKPVAEPKSEPALAPAKTETPKKETVKKEDAVISQTPSISYRIRKSADDSTTQIGAFSDLERAKAFASTHAADGYKVFDMYGNLIFEP